MKQATVTSVTSVPKLKATVVTFRVTVHTESGDSGLNLIMVAAVPPVPAVLALRHLGRIYPSEGVVSTLPISNRLIVTETLAGGNISSQVSSTAALELVVAVNATRY